MTILPSKIESLSEWGNLHKHLIQEALEGAPLTRYVRRIRYDMSDGDSWYDVYDKIGAKFILDETFELDMGMDAMHSAVINLQNVDLMVSMLNYDYNAYINNVSEYLCR